jgi:hypothetical protein
MKKYLINLLVAIVFFYLSFAFVRLEFDFRNWTMDARQLFVLLVAIASFIKTIASHIQEDINNTH